MSRSPRHRNDRVRSAERFPPVASQGERVRWCCDPRAIFRSRAYAGIGQLIGSKPCRLVFVVDAFPVTDRTLRAAGASAWAMPITFLVWSALWLIAVFAGIDLGIRANGVRETELGGAGPGYLRRGDWRDLDVRCRALAPRAGRRWYGSRAGLPQVRLSHARLGRRAGRHDADLARSRSCSPARSLGLPHLRRSLTRAICSGESGPPYCEVRLVPTADAFRGAFSARLVTRQSRRVGKRSADAPTSGITPARGLPEGAAPSSGGSRSARRTRRGGLRR